MGQEQLTAQTRSTFGNSDHLSSPALAAIPMTTSAQSDAVAFAVGRQPCHPALALALVLLRHRLGICDSFDDRFILLSDYEGRSFSNNCTVPCQNGKEGWYHRTVASGSPGFGR